MPLTENSNLYFVVQKLLEVNGYPCVATAQMKYLYRKSICKKSSGLLASMGDQAPSPCSRPLSGSKPTRDDEADKRWLGIAKLLVMPTACIWHAKKNYCITLSIIARKWKCFFFCMVNWVKNVKLYSLWSSIAWAEWKMESKETTAITKREKSAEGVMTLLYAIKVHNNQICMSHLQEECT